MPSTLSVSSRTATESDPRPKMTRFFKKKELEDFYLKLDLGDRLEFGHGLFEHFAIYVGPGEIDGGWYRHRIIHYTIPQNANPGFLVVLSMRLPLLGDLAAIQMTEIAPHVGLLGVRINNDQDNKTEPLEKEEIVRRAEEYLLTEFPQRYSAFSNNCEHMVNYCRYNIRQSGQASFLKGLQLMMGLLPGPISWIWRCVTGLVVYAARQLVKYFRGEDDWLAIVDRFFDELPDWVNVLLKIINTAVSGNALML